MYQKAARGLIDKTADTVLEKLKDIYKANKKNPMKRPEKLQSDLGSEFNNNTMKKYCQDNKIKQIFQRPSFHLPFVESFNRELAIILFRNEQMIEYETGIENTDWSANLNDAVYELNQRKNKLTKMVPRKAVKKKEVKQPMNNIPILDQLLFWPIDTLVRRLLNQDEYQKIFSGEIETHGRRRATDNYFSKEKYSVIEIYKSNNNGLYMHRIQNVADKKIYPHLFTYWIINHNALHSRLH